MENLFYNAGFGFYYLRINNVYYRRSNGIGWEIITQDKLPSDTRFFPLHDEQLAAFWPALLDQGLVSGEAPLSKKADEATTDE